MKFQIFQFSKDLKTVNYSQILFVPNVMKLHNLELIPILVIYLCILSRTVYLQF